MCLSSIGMNNAACSNCIDADFLLHLVGDMYEYVNNFLPFSNKSVDDWKMKKIREKIRKMFSNQLFVFGMLQLVILLIMNRRFYCNDRIISWIMTILVLNMLPSERVEKISSSQEIMT